MMLADGRNFAEYFIFTASRSSGPGGQNVNKVNSRIELKFMYAECPLLSDAEKEQIAEKLKNRINASGELVIVRQTERSQLKNKEQAVDAFYELIEKALKPRKKRIATKQTKASKEERLRLKKLKGEIKKLRKDIIGKNDID